MKKTIVFDFDGVIHRYSEGWKDGSIYDIPTPGIKAVIDKLRKDYKVVVVSTRCRTEEGRIAVRNWLFKNFIQVDDILDIKPPAIIYIDDRGLKFDGNHLDTLIDDIKNFKTWQEE